MRQIDEVVLIPPGGEVEQPATPPPPPPTTTTTAPTVGQSAANKELCSKTYHNLRTRFLFALCGMQLVFGNIAILLNIVGIFQQSEVAGEHDKGQGIWCGVLFLFAGGVGIYACRSKTFIALHGFVVLEIIAVSFTVALISISSTDLKTHIHSDNHENPTFLVALSGMMIVVGVGEAVLAIASIIICCNTLCCGSKPDTQLADQTISSAVDQCEPVTPDGCNDPQRATVCETELPVNIQVVQPPSYDSHVLPPSYDSLYAS